MNRSNTELPNVVIAIHDDSQWHFKPPYSTRMLADTGIHEVFVQDNQAYSARKDNSNCNFVYGEI